MTLSIWRYSHLALAVSSFVFIAIAAVTGIILAFEPISEQLKPYAVSEEISVGKTLETLRNQYDEVLYVEVDHNRYVSASVITEEGENEIFYINPETGQKIGEPIQQKPIFSFATNLHRSLFLKGLGRFFVGLASFLLFLIAVTGTVLIVKRQGSVKRFLSKISKESFAQHYHVYFGRLFLIPIIIITVTGVYLSLEKFELLPAYQTSHNIDFDNIETESEISVEEFQIFANTPISEVRRIEFPFSPFPEDYFLVQLKDRELVVNQFTGTVLSEYEYPLVALFSKWSLLLHTGRGSMLWSIVLGLASCSVLFFIYSGFAMTLKRKKKSALPKNKFTANEAEFVILVGSETGNTYAFASELQKALLQLKQKVFITEMNRFGTFPKMKQLIVLTSTYGDGEAPANATKFLSLLEKFPPSQKVDFSVVGFGSLAYDHFCQFAVEVDKKLQKQPKYRQLLPVHKINNLSFSEFKNWAKRWGVQLDLNPKLNPPETPKTKEKKRKFKVVERTEPNHDHTFLLKLRPRKPLKFKSGDLLAFTPPNEQVARLYSIANIENDILLSIKKHERGVCSNYFSKLKYSDFVKATIRKNKSFHFPEKASRVIMISNGTGIAPFLGMLQHNNQKTETHLYWGGRTEASFKLYEEYVQPQLESGKLAQLKLAFSREINSKTYVQDLLFEDSEFITNTLKNKGALMICGSVAMQKDVLQLLKPLVSEKLSTTIDALQQKGQLLMDCY